jgi:serine protease Do
MRRRRLAWCTATLLVACAAAQAAPLYSEASAAEPRSRPGLPDLAHVAETALPAVVGIVTSERDREAPQAGDPLKDLYDRFRSDTPRKGVATGFIIHPEGFIITNAHVVESASRVDVEIGDDERLPARVVGRDEASDVALLKVEAGRALPTLPLGDSDRLRTAEWVMVVGNPFGLSHTVTAGIVSHTGRSDVVPAGREGYYDFIQTDASINPGNSGGPLVNLRGEVIGIATAINATGQGIGFAVPINMAKEILEQLRDHGRVVRSWMGVSVRELRGAPQGRPREVVVTDVVHGGPAAEGGLLVGDVITGFEGRRIPSAARLRWYVSTAGVGRNVLLTVRRGAAVRSMHVELTELPEARAARAAVSTPGPPEAGAQ